MFYSLAIDCMGQYLSRVRIENIRGYWALIWWMWDISASLPKITIVKEICALPMFFVLVVICCLVFLPVGGKPHQSIIERLIPQAYFSTTCGRRSTFVLDPSYDLSLCSLSMLYRKSLKTFIKGYTTQHRHFCYSPILQHPRGHRRSPLPPFFRSL